MRGAMKVGDVVRFARDYADKSTKRETVTVKSIDPARDSGVTGKADGQTVDWRPRQWGAGKERSLHPRQHRIDEMRPDRVHPQ